MGKGRNKRANRTGRNHETQYAKVEYRVFRSPAYASLSNAAKALLMPIWTAHTGFNNGEIVFSARMAEDFGMSRPSGARALDELVKKGFLKVTREASFDQKRLARTFALTMLPLVGKRGPATNDYLNWRPEKHQAKHARNSKHSLTGETHSLIYETVEFNEPPPNGVIVSPARLYGPISTSHSLTGETHIYTKGKGETEGDRTPTDLSTNAAPEPSKPDQKDRPKNSGDFSLLDFEARTDESLSAKTPSSEAIDQAKDGLSETGARFETNTRAREKPDRQAERQTDLIDFLSGPTKSDDTPVDIRIEVKDHITRHQRRQAIVAEEIGMSPKTFGNWLRGRFSTTPEKLALIEDWMSKQRAVDSDAA